MTGQPCNRQRVLGVNRQQSDLIRRGPLANERIHWVAESEFFVAGLDHQLPDGRHTQKQLIRRISKGGLCRCAQVGTPLDQPQEGVRIEQEFHSMYSLNSSSGSSKSGAM